MSGSGVSGGGLDSASMLNAARRPCINAGRPRSMPAA